MEDSPRTISDEKNAASDGLSTAAAIAAVAGAIVLAFILYRLVGFPENVPLALGTAVLLAEIFESIVRGGVFSGRRLARAFVHSVVVAGAGWLGVWVAELLGWTA